MMGSWFWGSVLSVLKLTSRQGLNDVYACQRSDAVRRIDAVMDRFTINKNAHMLAEHTLINQHAGPYRGLLGKCRVQKLTDGLAGGIAIANVNVPLQVAGEAYGGHRTILGQ